LGALVFSTKYRITQVLGVEHIEPKSGSYKYGKEEIDWSYKPVKQVLELWLKSWLKSHLASTNEFNCDHLDILVTINHGKGSFSNYL
jgi:hypothetical protein